MPLAVQYEWDADFEYRAYGTFENLSHGQSNDFNWLHKTKLGMITGVFESFYKQQSYRKKHKSGKLQNKHTFARGFLSV